MRVGPSFRSLRSRQPRASRASGVRCGVLWPARAVVQGRVALGPPAADPLVGGRPGYAYLGRHTRDRTTGQNTLDENPPAMNGTVSRASRWDTKTSVCGVEPRHLHHTGGLHHDQDLAGVNNARDQYT